MPAGAGPRLWCMTCFGTVVLGATAFVTQLRSPAACTLRWPPSHRCGRPLPQQHSARQSPAAMRGRSTTTHIMKAITATGKLFLLYSVHLGDGADEGVQQRGSGRRAAHAPEQALCQASLAQAAVCHPRLACRDLWPGGILGPMHISWSYQVAQECFELRLLLLWGCGCLAALPEHLSSLCSRGGVQPGSSGSACRCQHCKGWRGCKLHLG